MKREIPIFFTFDTHYVLAACVTFHSLLRHASLQCEYRLYVLHTSLTLRDQKRLQQVVSKFPNAQLQFIDVSTYDARIAQLGVKAHYSKEIFYKLIAAELFPQYDRVLCSDVDVLFTGDVSTALQLWDDEDFYFAGVGPIENSRMPLYADKFSPSEMEVLEHEVAAGFLLMNLKCIRRDNKQHELMDFYVHNYSRLLLPEQDCIILCCWPGIRYLPLAYSLPVSFYRFDMNKQSFYQGNTYFAGNKDEALHRFYHDLSHPIQVHYAGFNKPWNSIFTSHWGIWMREMWISGCLSLYLQQLPYSLWRRCRRYNLKRFCGKVYRNICGK